MMLPFAFAVAFSTTISFGVLCLALVIGLAQFSTVRRDKRYDIANDELHLYQQKSERLETEAVAREARHIEKQHRLELKITELEGEVKRLQDLPNVAKLYELIKDHDDNMRETGLAFAGILSGIQEGHKTIIELLTRMTDIQ